MNKPHLAILVPHRDVVYAKASDALTMAVTAACMNVSERGGSMSYLPFYRSHVHIARWVLLQKAIEIGATEVLWFDDDATPPATVYRDLLARGKDMIVPWFTNREEPPRCTSRYAELTTIVGPNGEHGDTLKFFDALPEPGSDGLIKIATSGLHCCLMKIDAVKKVIAFNDGKSPFTFVSPISGKQSVIGEDVMFFQLALFAGVELWLDPTVKVGHIGEREYV